jgi:hypothetical protein
VYSCHSFKMTRGVHTSATPGGHVSLPFTRSVGKLRFGIPRRKMLRFTLIGVGCMLCMIIVSYIAMIEFGDFHADSLNHHSSNLLFNKEKTNMDAKEKNADSPAGPSSFLRARFKTFTNKGDPQPEQSVSEEIRDENSGASASLRSRILNFMNRGQPQPEQEVVVVENDNLDSPFRDPEQLQPEPQTGGPIALPSYDFSHIAAMVEAERKKKENLIAMPAFDFSNIKIDQHRQQNFEGEQLNVQAESYEDLTPEERLSPAEKDELLQPIKSVSSRNFFSPPDGFGAKSRDTAVMNGVRLLNAAHFDKFCRLVDDSRFQNSYPSELLERFSRNNILEGLTAFHVEILRTPIQRPDVWGGMTPELEKEVFDYQVQATQLFSTLFLVLSKSIKNLEDDSFSTAEIWNAGLCANHELRSVFRDYVVLENHLFSWLLPYSTHYAQLHGWSEECMYQFIDTKEFRNHSADSMFSPFPAENHPNEYLFKHHCHHRLSYFSPVWLLYKSSQSKAASSSKFVACAGDKQFNYLMGLLSSIRTHHRSSIPIEIFYLGEKDLSSRNRFEILNKFNNVRLKNLFDYVDQRVLQVKGWLAKPLSLLLAEGSKVALIDVDIGFVQSPENVFKQPSFLRSGALFFNDRRSIYAGGHQIREFLQSVTEFPSIESLNRRSLHGKNVLEQESGIVAIDKSSRFLGVLGVSKLMDQFLRKYIHGRGFGIYDGDKEFFFVGFEMMRQEFSFSRWYPGNIGSFDSSKNATCGRMLHFTDSGEPFWWNGGFKDGEDDGDRVRNVPIISDGNLTHYDDGGYVGEQNLPRWSHHRWMHVCISQSSRGSRVLSSSWRRNTLAAFHEYKKYCTGTCIA